VMVEMLVGELAFTRASEPREVVARQAEEWVVMLTGKPTIHQMMKLAEEISQRGGSPRDPQEYCRIYQDQLVAIVNQRIELVECGAKQPLDHGVAGVGDMLEALARRDIVLVLASGTEYEHVSRELNALGLQHFFKEHVYAPHGHDTSFSKASVINKILRELRIDGGHLVGFGDGVVETADVKQAGGCAVGVASDEQGGPGPDSDKRRRLIEAGADLIVPDFRDRTQLLENLGM